MKNSEYLEALDAKLTEKVKERRADKSREEMADVLEVLKSVFTAWGHSTEEPLFPKAKKAGKRSAPENKIFLRTVEDER